MCVYLYIQMTNCHCHWQSCKSVSNIALTCVSASVFFVNFFQFDNAMMIKINFINGYYISVCVSLCVCARKTHSVAPNSVCCLFSSSSSFFFCFIFRYLQVIFFCCFLHDSNIDIASHSLTNVNEVKCSNICFVVSSPSLSLSRRLAPLNIDLAICVHTPQIKERNKMWIYELLLVKYCERMP